MTLRTRATTIAAAVLACGMGPAMADPVEAELIVNEELTITTKAAPAAHLDGALSEVYSGWLFREDETRAMQMDDFDNPMFVYAEQGMDAWSTPEGTEGKSCMDCHGAIEEGMKGVRAAMPKVNAAGELWSLENFINDCRTTRMGAEAWKWNADEMKNMTTAVSLQSRGMPVAVAIDGPAAEFWQRGKDMYYTRFGQLELSCANCHEDNYGNYIRADHLSQGQTNGFPLYRLKDAAVVSIHQRFVGCVRDTRAETFAAGSQEFRELELYVASRGLGLDVEGAGVRP